MRRIRTRLQRLEERTEAGRDDKLERWAYRMANGNALQANIVDMSRQRANRRAILEGRDPLPQFRPYDDPRYAEMLKSEIEALEARYIACGDFWQALEAWCNEPEAEGWPRDPEESPYSPINYTGFRERLARARRNADDWRKSRLAVRWRANHPEWRLDLSEAEHDAWELGRIIGRPVPAGEPIPATL